MFFSYLKRGHLIVRSKNTANRQTSRKRTQSTQTKKHEVQAAGLPWSKAPPRKRNDKTTATFQGGGFFSFPPGSNLSLSLWPCCRKVMFDAADVVVVVLTARVSTRSVVGEVCLTRFEPTPRSRSRRRWFVLSPRSGDTTVRVFQDPYQPMII